MKKRIKKSEFDAMTMLTKIVPIVFSAISFLGGILVSLFTGSLWFTKNVATIPYVDTRHEEALKFAEKAAVDAKIAAFDHSDMNRKDLMMEIKAQGVDIKALGSKQDILLDSIKTVQQNMFETRKR